MKQILVAPDSFGDTLTAGEAAAVIAAGWLRSRPDDQMRLAPQSDGGPGFVAVLAGQLPGAQLRKARVRGPLEAEVEATWLHDGSIAYIECAQACGLSLLPAGPTVETAWRAHSVGVGQLIGAALDAGVQQVVVGLGGSSCTDGGSGMIDALGGPVLAVQRLAGVELVAATDVEHPLLGEQGAAAVFGPQKGADTDTVRQLEERLTQWIDELEGATGHQVRSMSGAGAAGGIGAALLALGGRRESGAQIVAEHIGLEGAMTAADLVITGEGKFDSQTLHGKVVGAVAERAARLKTPVLVLAGQVTLSADEYRAAGIDRAESISQFAGSVRQAIDDAHNQLTGLAQRVAGEWPGQSSD